MEKGWKTLFDVKFETYITPAIAGVVMIISYVLVTIMWLAMVFQSGLPGFLMALIGIPVSFVFIRIWFESLVALIKTAEASGKIAKLMENQGSQNQS